MAEQTKNTELAWAAGLFEAEGHVGARAADDTHSRHRLLVTLSSCDRDVVDRFACAMGVGTVREVRPQQPRRQIVYTWQITGKAAKPVVEALLPWMGERRAAAMRRGLEVVKLIGPTNAEKTHCPQGHPYSPENTFLLRKARMCRACNIDRCRKRYWLRKVVAAWPS